MMSYLKVALNKGLIAAKKNAIAAVTLQVFAITLVALYYLVPSFKAILDKIGDLNILWFPWFAMILTMTFGGIIPLMIESARDRKGGETQRSFLQIIFTLGIWALNGLVAVWFYSFQAKLFGDDSAFFTIVKKVCVDQFIYVPFYVVPMFTLLFLWRDLGFSTNALKGALGKKNFFDRAVPLMISNWFVWIPAASIMYAFPLPLQLILMNLILVFWSLILSFFVSE